MSTMARAGSSRRFAPTLELNPNPTGDPLAPTKHSPEPDDQPRGVITLTLTLTLTLTAPGEPGADDGLPRGAGLRLLPGGLGLGFTA